MLDRPVTVITGATSGLGVPLAAALAAAGRPLVLGARSLDRAARARAVIRTQAPDAAPRVEPLDLASQRSVRAFAAALRGVAIDRLVLNAALMAPVRRLTEDGFETMLATNLLGHAALLGLLRDRLTPDARVVVQSSEAHRHGRVDFDDLMGERRFRPVAAYNASKLAQHILAVELDRRWPVEVVVSQPGWVNSELGREVSGGLQGLAIALGGRLVGQTPAEGARSAIQATLAADLPGAATGRYLSPTGLGRLRGKLGVLPADPVVVSPELGSRVLAACEKLTGVQLTRTEK